jgi:hypothetical protein
MERKRRIRVNFAQALSTHFPQSLEASEYVSRTLEGLRPHGFQATNTIACVSVCRDELTRPLVAHIQGVWGEAFNFSSLAGMLYLGTTGFQAAHHHAPNDDGCERYVYFAFPHIAIDAYGEIGRCFRSNRKDVSHACGALLAFQKELAGGTVQLGLDPDNLEHSLLKQGLFRKLKYGEVPDLIHLTKIASAVILEDLERMIQLTVDTSCNHYAVFTGIQIHGPDSHTSICPGIMYAVMNGQRHTLKL